MSSSASASVRGALRPFSGRLPLIQGSPRSACCALRAVALAFRYLRIVAEPGGAVALAAALFRDDLPETVICTVSGGNADPEIFAGALARFGG